MDYAVAIPSYRRAKILEEKTLAMLQKGGVAADRICIFVASEEEGAAYAAALPKVLYGKIVVGVLGITPQRRFIAGHYPEGKCVVSIDDDVASLHELRSDGTSGTGVVQDVHGFFIRAFRECQKERLFLWGVYPVNNHFFMTPKVTHDFKFVLATLYGFINRRAANLLPTVAEKEDYEMSLLYYLKDGGVVRFNGLSVKTRFHNPVGGLGAVSGRFEANEAAAQALARRYPEYFKVWHRKTGMAELRLARKPRRFKTPPSTT